MVARVVLILAALVIGGFVAWRFMREPDVGRSVLESVEPATPASRPVFASGRSAPSARAAESSASASEIRGRVVDRGGIPITHAKVRVVLRFPNDQPAYATAASFEQSVPVEADGRFRVAVPRHGKYLVFVDPPGFGMTAREWVNPGEDVELVADAPASIDGRVVRRADGVALAGARVVVFPQFWDRFVREAKSDAAGRFAFTGLPVGKVSVSTWIEGLVGHWEEVALSAGETKVQEVSLERGIVVSGKVAEAETGRPIEGASFGGPERVVTTNARGEFTMAGLTTGNYTFEVWAPGRVRTSVVAVVDEARAPDDLSFSLAKGEIARGLVVDADTGQPIEGVGVASEIEVAKTDARGGFEVLAKPSEWLTLGFRHPSYSATRIEWKPHVAATGSATMRLERADVRVAGRVTARDGSGIADARVRCVTTSNGCEGPDRVTGTDRDGRYEFTGCPRHCGFDVIVIAPGFTQIYKAVKESESVPSQVDFVLDRCAVVVGVVVDEAGNPVNGAELVLSGANFGGYAVGGDSSCVTRADGRFRVIAPFEVLCSSVALDVRAAGFVIGWQLVPVEGDNRVVLRRTGRIRGRLVDSATGDAVTNATLAILPAHFDPRRHAWNRDMFHRGRTAESAGFDFDAPPGSVWLIPEAAGYVSPTPTTVAVVSGEVVDVGTIRLQQGGAFEGTIRRATGEPATAQVFVRDASREVRMVAETDGVGWYRADRIAPGSYEVFAVEFSRFGSPMAGFSPVAVLGTVTVALGSPRKLDGSLPAPATLQIVVSGDVEPRPNDDLGPDVDDDEFRTYCGERPNSELVISAVPATPIVRCDWDGLAASIDVARLIRQEGVALQEWLPAGRYAITFKAAGYEPRELSATLVSGKETTVNLVLKRVP